jgi:hypothetical protein
MRMNNPTSPLPGLGIRTTPGARVEELSQGVFRLFIPGGLANSYRWAQLDDYAQLNRGKFLWNVPCSLELKARVSAKNLPGTWGFGFWNDPFAASQGIGGMFRRLPALPNAAWFFNASPPNFLSLRDDRPAQGLLAATFSSPHIPAPLLAPGLLGLPLLALPAAARLLRRLGRLLIKEESALVPADPTQWRLYQVEIGPKYTAFFVDRQFVAEFPGGPRPPLGLVIWIDNQYAAFSPDGRVKSGTLPNPPGWLEVEFV